MEHFFGTPRNFTPAMHFSCTFSSSFYISAMKVISGAEIRMSLPKFLRFRLVDRALPDAGAEISFLLFNLACLLACPLQEEVGGGRGEGGGGGGGTQQNVTFRHQGNFFFSSEMQEGVKHIPAHLFCM
jgi:hypothetical protein